MKTLQPLRFEEANVDSQAIFTNLESKLGTVPNLYAAMGVSDKLLAGFLNFSEILKSGEFSKKEYEAIALATSQANGCNYCLAAHTALGKMNGFTEAETIGIRSNEIADFKLNALVALTNELVHTKGHPANEVVGNFLAQGYTKSAFAELLGAVALTTITNYVYHNGSFEIDFPRAKDLEAVNS